MREAADLLQSINQELLASADPQIAENLRWFFKETVDPYGVRGTEIRKVASTVYREVKHWPVKRRDHFCEHLWKTGKLEAGVLVSHLYRRFRQQCGAREFAMFERWLDRYVRNWAHTDGVAGWLIAASVENDPALIERLYSWNPGEESLEAARLRRQPFARSQARPQYRSHLSNM